MTQDNAVQEHFQKMGEDGSYAAFYGDRSVRTHDFLARRERVQEFLGQCTQPGQSVLDIGCGTGPMVEFFGSRGLRYHGLDSAQSMLDSLWQQFRNAPYADKIQLKVGSCEQIPHPDGSFDILVAMGLLEYLDDLRPTLREIARVLKPEGVAVLTIPNYVSLNRFAMRNGKFITTGYHLAKRLFGAAAERRQDIAHKELAPKELDGLMAEVAFDRVGRAFYDYNLICYPVNRLFPRLAYAINSRIENKGPTFLANGYIGFYKKQNPAGCHDPTARSSRLRHCENRR